ncbi:MAG: HEAT repeat domain-containing protein, partial [Candidatus Heimdallarchaeota archaeon]|nr:HEAT repeat domain-containing protein [Candidatus Heimdallarchaeota archaeon]
MKKNGNIKKLIKIVTSKDGDIKIEAAKALVDIGEPVIESLFELIKESFGEKGVIAVSILVAIGEQAVEPLLTILKAGKYSTRHLVVEALGRIGDSRANEAVLNAIGDDDYFVSGRAMFAAVSLVGYDAQAPIIKSMKENGDNTHGQMTEIAAVKTLGEIGDQNAVPEIIKVIKRHNVYNSNNAEAAISLGKIAARLKVPLLNTKISKILSELVSSNLGQSEYDSPLVCASAAWALGDILDNHAGEALLDALKNENSVIRSSAAHGLRCTIGDQTIQALINALEDNDSDVRANVVEALGVSCDERAINPLITGLEDSEETVREKVVQALGFFKGNSVIDLLITCLKDESIIIRSSAVISLGTIGGSKAIDALISVLRNDQNASVK